MKKKIPIMYFRDRRGREWHLLALYLDDPGPHPAWGDSKAPEYLGRGQLEEN